MSQDDEEAVHPNAVEVSPAPITIYDAEGILRYVNPAAVAFANADSADEVVGRPASEFVHPADREEIGRRIEQVIAEREPTEPTEFRFVALDGEEKYAETAGTPMTYEGEPAGQAILNDITERKRAQRKLQRQNERLEELVSAMAHDLRNPLHVANASVELLETSRSPTPNRSTSGPSPPEPGRHPEPATRTSQSPTPGGSVPTPAVFRNCSRTSSGTRPNTVGPRSRSPSAPPGTASTWPTTGRASQGRSATGFSSRATRPPRTAPGSG
ncbi:hypothetical protein BRD09_02875 [Halobacteriales archaeon SW_10_68_16]|nr:MAG: hypothetical protein BRD09_02875 [Halobacteriales archaeon SW_10_68_16]